MPKAGDVAPGKFMCGDLLAGAPEQLIQMTEPYIDGAEPAWASQMKEVKREATGDGSELEQRVAEQWKKVSVEAARARFRPVSETALARVSPDTDTDAPGTTPPKQREGRHGGIFGTVVHHAIGLLLRSNGSTVQEAVERASKLYGLTELFDEAVADVTRALDALRAAGLALAPGLDLQLEYPIAGSSNDGQLLSGYIDLVAVTHSSVDIIDFKTDTPPSGPVEQTYPQYVAQVRIYSNLLEATGILKNRRFRPGLLFTANGSIHWLA